MNSETSLSGNFSSTLRFFIGFASIGLSIFFLHNAAYYFNSFFLALLIVLATSPVMYWLKAKNFPAWLALIVGLAVAIFSVTAIALIVAMSITRTLALLPSYATQLHQAETWLKEFFGNYGINSSDILNLVDTNQLVALAQNFLSTVLDGVSLLFLTILIVVFMLIEAFIFPDKIDRQLNLGNPRFLTIYQFTNNIRQYVRITTVVGLVGGGVIAIVLYFFGIEFPVMWGALYFVMNYVPLVGFWIALLPVALLAWLQLGPLTAVLIILIYMILSSLINQVVKPAFMRQGLDLSPLWSIMSLIIWSAILGAPGLIVGVPLTIATKELLLETDEDNRWVAELISGDVRSDDPPPNPMKTSSS
jgi:predicted PurR-regulated permease PerM